MLAVLRDFIAMLRNDPVLVALLLCAVPYMVTFGGMRPFLFWANSEWFGASDTAWTVLLDSARHRRHRRRAAVRLVQPSPAARDAGL